MFAQLLLLVAPLLMPAFLSLAFIAPDVGVLGATSAARSRAAVVRPVAVSVTPSRAVVDARIVATPEAAHGKAHASCPGRKAPTGAARQTA
jgi:hypothetical protein